MPPTLMNRVHAADNTQDISKLLGSKLVNIVTDTGDKLLERVPKQMVIFFCGWTPVGHLLAANGFDNDPDMFVSNQKNALIVPHQECEREGVKLLINWMQKTCHLNANTAKPLHAPTDLFAACSLSRAMRVFGLHKDANRIDRVVLYDKLNRPLEGDVVEKIWKAFPPESRYHYWIVENVKATLLDKDGLIHQIVKDDLVKVKGKIGLLAARVDNDGENEQWRSHSYTWDFPGLENSVLKATQMENVTDSATDDDADAFEGDGTVKESVHDDDLGEISTAQLAAEDDAIDEYGYGFPQSAIDAEIERQEMERKSRRRASI